ncbi:hypothetical protein EBT31_11355, partial [bacterium]|nr:hypothetical protein [bacterium]
MSRPHYEGVYKTWPKRYFTGLTPSQKVQREQELLKRASSKHPKLAKTDLLAKPRKSQWTKMFHEKYPNLKFNKNAIAARTGIPRSVLNTVYNRGMKAWQTSGSRVGANPHQWAIARVYKFVLVTKNKVPTTRVDPNKNLR